MSISEAEDRNQAVLDALKKYLPEGCVTDREPVPVEGHGCRYQDANGREYLDFTSGIFTNSLGHGRADVNRAAYDQACRLANIHGRHSEAELRFYQRLFPYLPVKDYKAISYNDGGYTIDRGLTDILNFYEKKRIGIGAYRNGFHGKTQAAKLLINETESASLYRNFQIDFPNCYRCPWGREKGRCAMECVASAYQTLEEQKAGALIFEPIQGAGVILPPEGYWKRLAEFCRSKGILLFADEVLTGGGRVGQYLASSYYGIVPDMIALTKGLANGKPLSVLLERDFMTRNRYAVRPMERSSTFAAYPEALAAAAELLHVLETEHVLENVRATGGCLKEGLLAMKGRFQSIGEIRSLGLMAAVEFVSDPTDKVPFTEMAIHAFQKCRENGLEVLLNGHILRLAPPLIIEKGDLQEGLALLERSIAQAEEFLFS